MAVTTGQQIVERICRMLGRAQRVRRKVSQRHKCLGAGEGCVLKHVTKDGCDDWDVDVGDEDSKSAKTKVQRARRRCENSIPGNSLEGCRIIGRMSQLSKDDSDYCETDGDGWQLFGSQYQLGSKFAQRARVTVRTCLRGEQLCKRITGRGCRTLIAKGALGRGGRCQVLLAD